MPKEEMVTITFKEYRILLAKEDLLNCLQRLRVDKWFGYSEAYEMHGEFSNAFSNSTT